MTDQQAMWNQGHAAQVLAFGLKPSTFAQQVSEQVKTGENILELGCGVGGDAELFADSDANVTATDFSEVVIAQNRQRSIAGNLRFETMEISQPFPFADVVFDIVYAHLSLHYFDDSTTVQILAEIARVLKTGGRFYFACKSIHDPLYGQGTLIGPDMYDLNGHVRHFFSIDYATKLLEPHFEIVKLGEESDSYSGKSSSFIRCWAVKR